MPDTKSRYPSESTRKQLPTPQEQVKQVANPSTTQLNNLNTGGWILDEVNKKLYVKGKTKVIIFTGV